ncbi:MAG: hypothetical protein KME60_26135 [Cyanomargarita calcarea GSE-NOS-MK-12-04C]|jgi:hypothetical protein|uniref:Uncharacterized protein n=1 Tax=Cyanomargarita calcarea GSE-NOS-MK-12-04C TaxID=2839659 RepID=A0A951QTH7_9CYAN|nr:hypothetical protein [Cyanomargarita calcarea GSE-NOS-MK-12-04C]
MIPKIILALNQQAIAQTENFTVNGDRTLSDFDGWGDRPNFRLCNSCIGKEVKY